MQRLISGLIIFAALILFGVVLRTPSPPTPPRQQIEAPNKYGSKRDTTVMDSCIAAKRKLDPYLSEQELVRACVRFYDKFLPR
jgi:hypothetical protein